MAQSTLWAKVLECLTTPKLRSVRSWLLPISRHELRIFTPVCLIFFLLTLVYDLLRPLKSALIVAEPGIGAELIPYIKVWGVLPGAFLLTSLTVWLTHYFNREKIFYIVGLFYCLFFGTFLLVLYPMRDELALTSLAEIMRHHLPDGFHHMSILLEKWVVVAFYSIAELWGNIFLSMLFWGFANEINSYGEAKRFYPLYLLAANSAAIFAGQAGVWFSDGVYDPSFLYGSNAWEQAIFWFMTTAICGTCAILAIFRMTHWLAPALRENDHLHSATSKKMRLTLFECLRQVVRNRHMALLAIIVLSYNLVFNLSDILWTHELNKLYQGDINGYTHYTSQATMTTGFVAVFISLFVTSNVLRRWGWKHAALITPSAVCLFAIGFFTLLIGQYSGWFESSFAIGGHSIAELLLLLGTMQMAISRGCKYTVFDTTKELAFFPLNRKEKRIGKAVIDGIGSRIGKSSGSLIFQLLFFVVPTLDDMVPIISIIIALMLGGWTWATFRLATRLP